MQHTIKHSSLSQSETVSNKSGQQTAISTGNHHMTCKFSTMQLVLSPIPSTNILISRTLLNHTVTVIPRLQWYTESLVSCFGYCWVNMLVRNYEFWKNAVWYNCLAQSSTITEQVMAHWFRDHESLLKKFLSKMKGTTQGYDCNSIVMFRIGNSSFKSVICGEGRVVPVLN